MKQNIDIQNSNSKKGLRVIVITQGVSRILQPLCDSPHKIVGIIESAPRSYKKKNKERPLVNYAMWVRHGFKKNFRPLELWSRKKHIPYFFMTSSIDYELEEWITTKHAEIIVVFSMSQLLKDNIFSIPPLGAINMHPSYLPEYRGPNPDLWQYINMEMNPGVTIHYIDNGEDTGDIIYQGRTPTPLGIKSPERLDLLIGQIGGKLLLKALDDIELGIAPRLKQPSQSPTPRARNLSPEEHSKIIDWANWPIEKVWHVLRGTELWLQSLPQPNGIHKGQDWVVEDFVICDMSGYGYGQVYRDNGKYFVATKGGKIFLSIKFSLKKVIKNILQ